MDLRLERHTGPDPRRISEFNMGGPHSMDGWILSDGIRIFNEDRSRMWFAEVVGICVHEGLDYAGHKLL